jgi:ubiquinone/menaquinone biosynthesis C-methylase UbiE
MSMNLEGTSLVEQGYDVVYEAWPRAATLHRIWRERVIGSDYPDGCEHISFASAVELRRLIDALNLRPGHDLVDLACGAGGSGLFVARETETRLTGVDFSAAGLELARQRADALNVKAHFVKGPFAHTGLPDASMDAAMS